MRQIYKTATDLKGQGLFPGEKSVLSSISWHVGQESVPEVWSWILCQSFWDVKVLVLGFTWVKRGMEEDGENILFWVMKRDFPVVMSPLSLWFCSMNNSMSSLYQFSHIALKSLTGLHRALNSWNKPSGSITNSSLPLHEGAARCSKTLVYLQAWGDSMYWLILQRMFYISQGQTLCVLKRNFKSCGNRLQNCSGALNLRGFERISNQYGKMGKVALVT